VEKFRPKKSQAENPRIKIIEWYFYPEFAPKNLFTKGNKANQTQNVCF
jgi:hypothetical protein